VRSATCSRTRRDLLGGDVGEQLGDVVHGGDAQFGAVGPVGVAVDELVQAVVDDGLDEGPGPVAEPFPQRGDAVEAGEQVGRVVATGEYSGAQVHDAVGVQQAPGTFGGGDAGRVGVVGGGDARRLARRGAGRRRLGGRARPR